MFFRSVVKNGHQSYSNDIQEAFIVQPSAITLIPSIKKEATVVISTSLKVAQPFETVLLNAQECLTVMPNTGMIPTGRSLPITIDCRKRILRDFDAVLRIYTENDKRDIIIRVKATEK